ncbi:MAG: small multi-drug export (modular protein) [Candidatus Cloacimonadota bacterium]|nr:MAG: small multi-drug export (modular protein) [Candidatus Cloacimonadota bacterium]
MAGMKKILIILILLCISLSLLGLSGFKEKLEAKIELINVSSEVKVFLIAMIPIFELRGAIPIGILKYELPLWKVIPIALAGNMFPIFFILLFFDIITKICFKIPFLKKLLEAIFARTRRKTEVIQKYEEIGLMLFVAIPLPITGAWTGSLAAYLFGLKFWKSILFIFMGVCIAAVVVTFLTSLKWIGAGIAFAALIVVFIYNQIKKKS